MQPPRCRQISDPLQGYLIGNGVTDPEIDGNALPSFARGKSLISHGLYRSLISACNGSFWDAQGGATQASHSACSACTFWQSTCVIAALACGAGTECGALLEELNAAVADLNLYDVLQPCYNGAGAARRSQALLGRAMLQVSVPSICWSARILKNTGIQSLPRRRRAPHGIRTALWGEGKGFYQWLSECHDNAVDLWASRARMGRAGRQGGGECGRSGAGWRRASGCLIGRTSSAKPWASTRPASTTGGQPARPQHAAPLAASAAESLTNSNAPECMLLMCMAC